MLKFVRMPCLADESSNNDKNLHNLLYRIMEQRSVDDGELFRGLSGEHLQPRAAERSPSLRLRFGRSYPKYPVSINLALALCTS